MDTMYKIYFHNSKTKKKEEFLPFDAKKVTIYACGPTVYSYAHIGNARAAVAADLCFRMLTALHGKEHVFYARNITDVDDKIIEASKKEGIAQKDLCTTFAAIYKEDMETLGVLTPTYEPYATRFIPQMIRIIQKLLHKGVAYTAASGEVIFSVDACQSYGALSGRSLEDMQAGARVAVQENKKNPHDFLLWKPSDDETAFDSPFGKGRPGWHTECVAMIDALFGEAPQQPAKIDIHMGGQDLLFPHHENERAQFCCLGEQEELASFWLHNGFIHMNEEKMSKSIGNIILVHDLLQEGHPGDVIRMSFLRTHYRKPLAWNKETLAESLLQLESLYEPFKGNKTEPKATQEDLFHPLLDNFWHALCDDMNTPLALSSLGDLAKKALTGDKEALQPLKVGLVQLGLAQPFSFTDAQQSDIRDRISLRNQAKAQKNYAKADEIRASLAAEGVTLEDRPNQSFLFYKRGTSTFYEA